MEQDYARELPFVPSGPRRMSDTLVAFAEPLLDRLPRDRTLEEMTAMLQFAASIWNSTILRDIREARAHLATRMPPRLRVRPSRQLGAIRRMLARKWRNSPDDDHFIANVGVRRGDNGFWVTAIGVCPDPGCCGPQALA
jgi:hypothetical protein